MQRRPVSAIGMVLRQAAKTLEEYGWTYRGEAVDDLGRACCPLSDVAMHFSVDGALLLAAWCHQPFPLPEWETHYLELADAADAQFQRVHGRGAAAAEGEMVGVAALCRLLREAAEAHELEVAR